MDGLHASSFLQVRSGTFAGTNTTDTSALFANVISTASTVVGNEHNILYNAHRKGYTITQSGTGQVGSTNAYFDGSYNPNYSGDGIDPANPFILTISGLPNIHTQTGGIIGWTGRYWNPIKFKVEGFNSWVVND